MTRLWVDDMRPAPDGWLWAKTYTKALDVLSSGDITDASLDHDLGYLLDPDDDDMRVYPAVDVSPNGLDIVYFIVDNSAWPTDSLAVHSANPFGARLMNKWIRSQGPYASRDYFRLDLGKHGVVDGIRHRR